MKLKRLMALGMAAVMTMSLTACGGSGDKPTGGSTETDNKTASNDSAPADSTAACGGRQRGRGGRRTYICGHQAW